MKQTFRKSKKEQANIIGWRDYQRTISKTQVSVMQLS